MAAAAPMGPQLTPQQAYILNEFNGQTYEPNKMDVQHTPLYDTVAITAATGTITTQSSQYFVNVAGKTIAQTNVQTSKKLDAPEAFTIKSFRWFYQQNILLADLYAVLAGGALEFIIGNKVYQRGPLWVYNAGGGIFAITNISSASLYNNGTPGRNAMHLLAINVVIDNQASFYAQLNTTGITLTAAASGGTGVTSQLVLDGLYARGVQ